MPRSLLNKLTLENFQSITDQLLAIQITSEDLLKGIVGLVFDKAHRSSIPTDFYTFTKAITTFSFLVSISASLPTILTHLLPHITR
jgi:hypothetical protein